MQLPASLSWRRACGVAIALASPLLPGTSAADAPPAPPPAIAWEVVFEDGFENGLGQWTPLWNQNGGLSVQPDTTSYRARSGSHSAYMSGGGWDGVPAPGPYRRPFISAMVTQPLDLSGYHDAYLEIWFWARFGERGWDEAYADFEYPGRTYPTALILSSWVIIDLASDPSSQAGWRKAILRLPATVRRSEVVLKLYCKAETSWAYVAEGLYIDDVRIIATRDADAGRPTDDPLSVRQWEVENRGQQGGCGDASSSFGLPEAWDTAGPVSRELIVAVLGDGVEPHPDLVLDPGIDVPTGGPGGGPRPVALDPVGTAAAGVVGALRDNGIGTAGVAPGVRVLPLSAPLAYDGGDDAQAVERAVARGAKVLLLTRPEPNDPDAFREAVERAVALGRVVVVPAGDGGTTYPPTWDTGTACRIASDAGGICVGASSPADEWKSVASCDGEAFWSSAFVGPGPDLVAPGTAGCTTDRGNDKGFHYGAPGEDGLDETQTCRAAGTAFAAARVAGVAALMLTASPGLSPEQVREILEATARDIDEPGPDDRTGAGRVDAAAAVRAAARTAGDLRPIPFLREIEPVRARAGDPGLLLTLRGSGFSPESVAIWDGEPRPTRFVSAQELQAEIGAANLADQRLLWVGVATPPPGGGTTDATFPFDVEGDATAIEPAAPFGSRCPEVGRPSAFRVAGGGCEPWGAVDYQFDFGDGTVSDWIPGTTRAPAAPLAPPAAAPSPEDDAAARRLDAERLLPALREQGTLRVIVELAAPSSIDLSAYAVAPPRHYEMLPLAALTVDEAGLLGLAADAPVRRIWRDELRRASLAESVPRTGAPRVWSIGPTGRGQAVAVLDTGVDATHPMLAGRVTAEACFSSMDGALAATSVCPGGLLRVEGPGSAAPCLVAGCEHGTHVAGIAAGGREALAGVAPEASIVALQVFTRFGSWTACGGSPPCIASYTSDQVAALDWLLARHESLGVVAANMSLGGGMSSVPCDDLEPTAPAIAALRAAGVATVVAAGNDGYSGALSYPACVSSAVSVAGADDEGFLQYGSNFASQVTLIAPGYEIVSGVPGGGYASLSGTSMAAPHVSGAVALLREARPGASVDELVAALRDGGVELRYSYVFPAPQLTVPQAWGVLVGGGEARVEHAWDGARQRFPVRVRSRCTAVPGALSGWSQAWRIETRTAPLELRPPRVDPLSEGVYALRPFYYRFYLGSASSVQCWDYVQYELDWGDGTGSGWLPRGRHFARKEYGTTGTFQVRGRTRLVSDSDEVSEWSEPATIEVGVFKAPDWTVKWSSLKRSCNGKGAALRCTLKGKLAVQNRGVMPAPTVGIELQLRGAGTTKQIGVVWSPGLRPEAKAVVKVTVLLPAGEKGTGALVAAVVDPEDRTEELDEANNEAVFGPLR